MTKTQVEYLQLLESRRHNEELERQGRQSLGETERHAQVSEQETERHNKMSENASAASGTGAILRGIGAGALLGKAASGGKTSKLASFASKVKSFFSNLGGDAKAALTLKTNPARVGYLGGDIVPGPAIVQAALEDDKLKYPFLAYYLKPELYDKAAASGDMRIVEMLIPGLDKLSFSEEAKLLQALRKGDYETATEVLRKKYPEQVQKRINEKGVYS